MSFERTWTARGLTGNPSVVVIENLNLPGGQPSLELEATSSGDTRNAPVYLFEGDVSLVDFQARLTEANPGRLDALACIPTGGTVTIRIPYDISRRLTIGFEGSPSQNVAQAVTIRIREV